MRWMIKNDMAMSVNAAWLSLPPSSSRGKFKAFLPSLSACIQRLLILRDNVLSTAKEETPSLCSLLSVPNQYPADNDALLAHLSKRAGVGNSVHSLRQHLLLHQGTSFARTILLANRSMFLKKNKREKNL